MTIIRGPEPRENFQILPNATARDRRLSFRARGLLAMMLSYPPDWRFDRDWLARQTDGEGVTAVRTALQELERCGYLSRRRIQVNGRFQWSWKVYRTAQTGDLADQTTGGFPTDAVSTDGFPPSSKEGYEDLPEDVSSRVRDANDDEGTDNTSWRDEDRERFRSLVGDKLQSDGSRWTEGTFTADTFYDAFRKVRKHRWPGKRVEAIDASGIGSLENWLMDEGLEQVD